MRRRARLLVSPATTRAPRRQATGRASALPPQLGSANWALQPARPMSALGTQTARLVRHAKTTTKLRKTAGSACVPRRQPEKPQKGRRRVCLMSVLQMPPCAQLQARRARTPRKPLRPRAIGPAIAFHQRRGPRATQEWRRACRLASVLPTSRCALHAASRARILILRRWGIGSVSASLRRPVRPGHRLPPVATWTNAWRTQRRVRQGRNARTSTPKIRTRGSAFVRLESARLRGHLQLVRWMSASPTERSVTLRGKPAKTRTQLRLRLETGRVVASHPQPERLCAALSQCALRLVTVSRTLQPARTCSSTARIRT